MKLRDVSLSLLETDGGLKVWGCTFHLKGALTHKDDGSIDEKARKAKAKKIAQYLETIEIPDDLE